jgi:hypothetical protein
MDRTPRTVPRELLLRALAEEVIWGASIAKLYAELLARTLADNPTTAQEFETFLAQEQRRHIRFLADDRAEEEWNPPRYALERLRRRKSSSPDRGKEAA